MHQQMLLTFVSKCEQPVTLSQKHNPGCEQIHATVIGNRNLEPQNKQSETNSFNGL